MFQPIFQRIFLIKILAMGDNTDRSGEMKFVNDSFYILRIAVKGSPIRIRRLKLFLRYAKLVKKYHMRQ